MLLSLASLGLKIDHYYAKEVNVHQVVLQPRIVAKMMEIFINILVPFVNKLTLCCKMGIVKINASLTKYILIKFAYV